MTKEKFKSEIQILKKFSELYCKNKHSNQNSFKSVIIYKDEKIHINLNLCEKCEEIINYSIKRLQECPHEEKPRCRKCPNPCYEKVYWKNLSKIMRYSALKSGFTKIKKLFSK